jgi:predicted ATPase
MPALAGTGDGVMRLTRLYVRFFRSFNFDYERKASAGAVEKPWEMVDDAWFPFVRVDLDPAVTAVVGANESGKSHLIDALRAALTGEGIARLDFCRYSTLFSVEAGRERVPDLGLEMELVDDADADRVSGLPMKAQAGDRVRLLRLGDGNSAVVGNGDEIHPLDPKQLAAIQDGLPVPFQLETNVPLPDSISLDALLGRDVERIVPRRRRFELIELLRELPDVSQAAITASAPQILGLLTGAPSTDGDQERLTPAELGRRLLIDVAKIDTKAFSDLEGALRDGKEGQVGGLIEQMNRSLARHLNFNRWWTQDPDFQLRLAPRERELVFTIRDSTGTDYSFSERSRGLTYFLSYFVQLRAHKQSTERREVLLMDEPDAYLSSVGQQDLLRALEAFAQPAEGSELNQVVYVTHSPFLINKNAAHRIRVLDKGSNEEGTRVVRDVARNHYEPLRSSLGGYVAETAFVGGTNLLVEGVSDQVLLTGVTSLLRFRGAPPRGLLDLNEVTIVPAGSAGAVPYMAYLARGRDEIKPACVALLDGDHAGREAAKRLSRSSDVAGKAILRKDYVLVLSDWAEQQNLKLADNVHLREIEDLLSPTVAAEAARNYAMHLLGSTDAETAALTPHLIADKLRTGAKGSLWRAVELASAAALDGAHIEKVGFAKEVVRHLERVRELTPRPAGLPDLEHNFQLLLNALADRLARADSEEAERRSRRRSDRIVAAFLRDYPEGATRDEAEAFLRELEASLEASPGDDAMRGALASMRRNFGLRTDPLSPVPEFDRFCQQVRDLKAVRRMAYWDQTPDEGEPTRQSAAPQPAEAVEADATSAESPTAPPEPG